jgi:hypothetical protein
MGNGRVIESNPMERLRLSALNRPLSSARFQLYREEMEVG